MIIVRIWDCWNCGNKWIAKVEYTDATSNLSGERNVYCPNCNHRGSCGSPHKIIELDGDQLKCMDRYPMNRIENEYPTLISEPHKISEPNPNSWVCTNCNRAWAAEITKCSICGRRN